MPFITDLLLSLLLYISKTERQSRPPPRVTARACTCQLSYMYNQWLRASHITGLILGLRLVNERRRYFVTTSLIGWPQAPNQPCIIQVSLKAIGHYQMLL